MKIYPEMTPMRLATLKIKVNGQRSYALSQSCPFVGVYQLKFMRL